MQHMHACMHVLHVWLVSLARGGPEDYVWLFACCLCVLCLVRLAYPAVYVVPGTSWYTRRIYYFLRDTRCIFFK